MKRFSKLLYGLFFVGLFTLWGCQTDEFQSISTNNSESNFVEEKEALEIAGNFLEQNSDVAQVKTRANGIPELKMVYTDGKPLTRASNAQRSTYYIINYGDDGYIVVSASKGTYPILGYSTNGKFDPNRIPVNMRELLDGYSKEIRFAYDNVKIDDRIKQMRQTAIAGTNQEMNAQTAVSPLLANIHWNQAPYYNAYCPANCPVGCVATATSQIMRFYEYPARGKGYHSYNSSYGTLSFNYNYDLNWKNMPYSVLRGSNDDVASLCYGVAVGLDMGFSPSGSGTFQQYVPQMLKNYYSYPDAVTSLERSNYSTTQWESIVRNELDNRRPVQYAGSGDGGGHSFVCDGYSSNGYFHINWGWGGYSDGYFLLNALDPSGLGIGGGSGGFNYWQTIVVNFAPPGYNDGNDPDPTPDPTPTDNYAPSYSDYFNSTYIYYVSIGDMQNYSGASSYTFFNNKKVELEAGSSNYITLMPRFPNGVYPMYWCVWIDFNGNKKFEDNERVLAQYMNSDNYFYRMFKVPTDAVKGETRVRVSAKWGSYPKPDEHFTYGEVEDYTAVITKPSVPEPDPKPNPDPDPDPKPDPNPDPTPDPTPDPDPDPTPNPTTYCTVGAANFSSAYISQISLSTMTKVSGGSAYSDFTSYIAYASQGQSFKYVLTPGFKSSFRNKMYWRVYVDFNNDGVFSPNEKKVERYSYYGFSGYIYVPATTQKGNYRIRIIASPDRYQDPCGGFANGEVEDYTLQVR